MSALLESHFEAMPPFPTVAGASASHGSHAARSGRDLSRSPAGRGDGSGPVNNQTVYPQPWLPMLPSMLAPLLGSRMVSIGDNAHRLVSDFTVLRPEDLSAKEAEHAADDISTMVQGLLYGRRYTRALAAIRIDVPDGLTLGELPMSARVRVALQSRPFFDADGRWRHCTLADVVGEQAMGAKLLLSFLLALEAGMRDRLSRTQSPADDLVGDLERVVRESIYAPRSAEVFLRSTGWDGRPRESLVQIASRLGVSKERARQIFALASSCVERRIAGAAGEKPPERLLRAVAHLESRAPLGAGEAARLLHEEGLSDRPFHPEGLIHAARAFKIPCGPQLSTSSGAESGEAIVCIEGDRRQIGELVFAGRRLLRRQGVLCTTWLKGHGRKAGVPPRLLREDALQLICERWLGLSRLHLDRAEEGGSGDADAQPEAATCALPILARSPGPGQQETWYWPGRDGAERPQGMVVRAMKAVAFFGQVPWEKLSERLLGAGSASTRAGDGQGAARPCRAVLGALLHGWGLSIRDRGLLQPAGASVRSTCESVLPPVEAQLARLIQAHGGRMARGDFLKRAEMAGIKPNTALAYLKSSVLLRSREGHSDPWVELLVVPQSLTASSSP